jgi:hypothetical protein
VLLAILVVLGGFGALTALGFWLTGRNRRPPPADDLRRADDAQLEPMPTPAEVEERIGEIFGETRPLP